jgi:hypothetical protein
MPSWTCFYCSHPVNREGRYVEAQIRHHYQTGGSRDSERRFHPACFEKFQAQGCRRPLNPETDYEVLWTAGDEEAGR